MGKPKKGKKGRQDDDFGDDEVVDPVAQAEEAAVEQAVPKPTKKAKGKKGKRADDDWEDDVAKEVEALSLGKDPEVTNGDADEAKPVSGKSKKKDKKKNKQKKEEEEEQDEEEEEEEVEKAASRGKNKKGMSAFAMLDIEDVDDEEEEEEEEEIEVAPQKKNKKNKKAKVPEEEEESAEKETGPQPQPKKGGKKDKKKNEEEDIDAILADIEKPVEKAEGKKKKKKKEKLDDFPAASAEQPSGGFELVDIESMTQEQIAMLLGGDEDDEDDRKKKKKEKKKKKKAAAEEAVAAATEEQEEKPDGEETQEVEEKEGGEDEEEGGTVKTAAQKKKEKRERQKQQKLLEKQKQMGKGGAEKKEELTEEKVKEEAAKEEDSKKSDDEGDDEEGDKKKSKKDRRKKKGAKEEEPEKKKKPANKVLKAMQEALQRAKEEEEAMKRAEEERERKIEEARKAKAEAAALELERKEKEKQKKKEKIERQKREGTFKTKAQKEAEKRAREMLAARGLELPVRAASSTPDGEQKRKRIVYDNRTRRKKLQHQGSQEITSPTTEGPQSPETETPTPSTEEKMIVDQAPKEEEKEEEVLDSWELVEDKLEEEEKTIVEVKEKEASPGAKADEDNEEDEDDEEESESEEESSGEEDDDSSEESSSEEDSSDDEDLTADERAHHKAAKRIKRRRELAESKRNKDVLRAPVVCVLGHVDTGKTKILDKLRRTNVQDGEAGGITQQIGATNVPRDAIQDKTSMVKEFAKKELKLPGLLIIDTPGHESFSNLRNRGSSLCDIAILVVDIMHGLEPQTIESINLLRSRKTPFVVALNKIDRLFGWKPNPHSDIVNTLKKQTPNTKLEFEERVQMVTVQFAEQGLNVALFHENKNPREYISMCPSSAHSGDGMGNLVALICELSQSFLAERVAYIDDLQATVMEVKALPGLGMTIDVILVNGSLREGSTIVVAGTEGPIVTQVRGLLMPQPMRELRVKGAYIHQKEVKAAQGVKVIAKDLDKALAGLPLYVARYDDEIPIYREDLEQSLEDILKGIKVQQEGVFVQASTLGSLEALLEFLRTSKIPYAGINIGPVHRRDIMRASVMLERDSQYAVILAFDVKVEREAQEMADNLGVRIFTADIIYHLFDSFMAYRAELKRQKQEEYKFVAVFPCKLRVLPNCVFNSRDPIVVGVVVEDGFIKEGTPLCVPSKEFVEVGRVTSIENNHKSVDRASKGNEVCIKIESIPGEAPKLYGRHFDHTDLLMSKISRQSIDAVKNYFREEMSKNDWQLIVEMKQLFDIL